MHVLPNNGIVFAVKVFIQKRHILTVIDNTYFKNNITKYDRKTFATCKKLPESVYFATFCA